MDEISQHDVGGRFKKKPVQDIKRACHFIIMNNNNRVPASVKVGNILGQ